ncbi:MAG TPA: peptidase MA family metallohydrolase [bacterium]|nr:peptidase MA family metallohydrolase [bacterium]
MIMTRMRYAAGLAAALFALLAAAGFAGASESRAFRIEVKSSGGSRGLEEAVRRDGERALAKAAKFIGHEPTGPFVVYIAADDAEFEEYTGGMAPSWAIAVYVHDRRAVVMRAESFAGDSGYFSSVLEHELFHAALGHKFRARPGALPRWLNEGLAVHLSDAWESPESWHKRRADLYNAARKGAALDFNDLHYGFPSGKFIAELAYAQSHDFVSWLIKRKGEAGIRHLLDGLADGDSVDVALKRVYGDGLEGLSADWLAQAAKPAPIVWAMQFFAAFDTYIWTGMALLVIVAGMKVFLGFRRKRKFKLVYPGGGSGYDPEDDWDELDEEWDIDDYGHRPWRPGRRDN